MRPRLRVPAWLAADQQDYGVQLPSSNAGPLFQVLLRVVAAAGVLLIAFLVVWFSRSGYYDAAGGPLSVLDAFYYVTVSLSTTGYGDVVPHSGTARLLNALVITPLRLVFLIILVNTTIEVLTERTREQWRVTHWRKTLHDHTVIIGFGVKGRYAAETLLRQGVTRDRIVAVDTSSKVSGRASAEGFAAVTGDATRSSVLLRAHVDHAKEVLIATERDDTAVLATLTVRQLSDDVRIVVAVREAENIKLLRQSGADSVIPSSSAVGRLVGLSAVSPYSGAVMEDLIQPGQGLSLFDRPVTDDEVGRSSNETQDLVVAVKRGQRLIGFDDQEVATLRSGDRLVVIHRVSTAPEEEAPAPDDRGRHGTPAGQHPGGRDPSS